MVKTGYNFTYERNLINTRFYGGSWHNPRTGFGIISMEIGIVRQVNIDDEMRGSYLDYAMSVIVARALPDARDGLKPVHRRILYAIRYGLAGKQLL